MSDTGARPEVSVRKVPPAVPNPASRPAKPTFGTDNNNQDSDKRPKPSGNNPDSVVCSYPGKPSA